MLLINTKILLSPQMAIFEPHIIEMKELPFICHIDVSKELSICNMHENIEFLYVEEGRAKIRCNDELLSVDKGQIVTVNPYVIHQIFNDDGALVYHCLIVDKSFLKEHGIDIFELHFTQVVCDSEVCTKFLSILREYEGNECFRTAGIKSTVLDFMLLMCRRYTNPSKFNRGGIDPSFVRMQMAINYIKENIGKRITVDSIAAHVHVSKYHFLRQFKQTTGDTVVHYINYLRCEHAKNLLHTEKYSVKEVATLCGFDNPSYFAQIFKKHTGVTPGTYLKTICVSN